MEGTIQNGVVVLDGRPPVPEGTRVWVDFGEEDALGPPPPEETYHQYLNDLRQSIADAEAGVPGIPLNEAMERISKEFNLPSVIPAKS